MVTVSPARRRNVGAGIEPLMGVAMRGVPVKFTAVSATTRWILSPDSTGAAAAEPWPIAAKAAPKKDGRLARTPPAASP